METAYIGLGSNIGWRRKNLQVAISLLQEHSGVEVCNSASIYETQPVGPQNQPWYLNTALEIQSSLTPPNLVTVCKSVESDMGRIDSERWGPRLIDVDLLLVDGVVLNNKGCRLPHPELHLRRFVLLPLVELDPQLTHPELGIPLQELLERLEDDKRVIQLRRRRY